MWYEIYPSPFSYLDRSVKERQGDITVLVSVHQHIIVEHLVINDGGEIYKRVLSGTDPLWLVYINENGLANVNEERSRQLEEEFQSFIEDDSKL